MTLQSFKFVRTTVWTAVLVACWSTIALADDCNNNGIDDAVDIANGTSQDCQPDGVPDECQLVGNDCNADGVPDECGTLIECAPPETQVFISSDRSTGDRFGSSVALNGDVAAIGAYDADCADGDDCGAVYVFRRIGDTWMEETKLTASDGQASDQFGGSVAVSGDRILIGATGVDCAGGGEGCGAAYVFRYDGGSWLQEDKLFPFGFEGENNFGFSVALDGAVALVGAPVTSHLGNPCDGSFPCGMAYVFRFDGASWLDDQILLSDAADMSINLGYSVALEGNRAVVGAPDSVLPGGEAGAAFVFEYDGGSWNEVEKLTFAGNSSTQFGDAVALQGDVVVVGAHQMAFIYRFDGFAWTQEADFTVSGSSSSGWFGDVVAVRGDRALVAMPGASCSSGFSCGAVYLYGFDGIAWEQIARLSGSDTNSSDYFGTGLAIDPQAIVVGAMGTDCPFNYCGTAYSFDLAAYAPDCNCNSVADVCESGASDCNSNQIPDECDIANGEPDVNDNGIPDLCEFAPTVGDDTCHNGGIDTGAPCGTHADCPSPTICGLKSRYLALTPSSAVTASGTPRTIQVTIVSMPPFPARVGEVWWAGPEVDIPNAPLPTLRGAQVECTATPHAQVWTTGVLYLYGTSIVPNAVYEVRHCDAAGGNCSAPLSVGTSIWGNAVAVHNVVNFSDIAAFVAKFRGLSLAPIMPRADLVGAGNPGQPSVPNQSANFADVSASVDAFRTLPYPYTVPACP